MREGQSMEEDRGMGGYSELESQKPELKTEGTHWVADLFPPRFTVQDLLEGSSGRPRNAGPRLPEPGSSLQLAVERRAWERSRRVQEIYRAALQEAQRSEGELRRERLSERIVREAEAEGEADPGSQEAEEEEERCIWTQQDLRALRGAVREAESKRRALEARLGQALAEGERLREERTQLRGLLDEREGELARSQRAAAQQALRLEALRAEGRRKDAELEARAAEARDRGEEARRAGESLRKAREEVREGRRENADLAWELERLRKQQEEGGRLQAEAVRVEGEAALHKLRRELEDVRAELEAERLSHARSHAALELLRRHFTSQPQQDANRNHEERISYM